jgi:hypothetical protein
MSRTCSVCKRPDAAEIAAALAQHTSIREMERRFGVTRSAVNRHAQNCISVSLALAQAATTAEPILHQMRDLNRRTLKILQAAERSGDHQVALQAISQCRRNLELCARLSGELDPRSSESGQGLVVNIVYSDSERAKSVVDASKPVLDALPEPSDAS